MNAGGVRAPHPQKAKKEPHIWHLGLFQGSNQGIMMTLVLIKRRAKKFFREWVLPVGLGLLFVAPLRSAVLDWNWVPSGSMKPTIVEGELVLVNKLAYDLKFPFTTRHLAQWRNPVRGDIVVFFSPRDGERLVKRVIGLPGDVIEMKDDVLAINGRPLEYKVEDAAPYRRDIFEDRHPVVARESLEGCNHLVLAFPQRLALRTFGPYVVPAGEYFMMGDSRDNSADSRFFGGVKREAIIGKATVVLLSFDTQRYLLPRPGRFFHPLASKQI
jgi:signal peptidase I